MHYKKFAHLFFFVGTVTSFQTPVGVRPSATSSLGSSRGVVSDYDRDDFVNDRHMRDRGEYGTDLRAGSRSQFRREGFRVGGYGGSGGTSVRPDIQDLRGMQDGGWDRYRYNNRDRVGGFRSSRYRSMRRPHFIADESEIGMPVDGPPSTVEEEIEEEIEEEARMREEEREFRGVVVRGESMREREWRADDERRLRRGLGVGGPRRFYSQEMMPGGFGPPSSGMPMRRGGEEWDEFNYDYPPGVGRLGRGGGSRYYDSYDQRRRDGGGSRRMMMYDDEFGFRGDFDDEFDRDGPYSVRGAGGSSRSMSRGGRSRYSNNNRFDDGGMRRSSYGGGDRDRFYPSRSRGVYSGSIRDERGNIGGPTQQDLFGRDSQYTSRQQSWSSGTSFDVI